MGALQGTLTYKLFYVQGEGIEDFSAFKEGLVERVEQRAFEPLDAEGEDDERYGWVPIENPLRVEFELFGIMFDHFINLGLRRDRWSIPSALLKAHVSQAERAFMLEHDKDKLSKFEREDIKLLVSKKLKERSLPRMRVIDMSWDLRSGRVRFWNQSNKNCEMFQGLFEDTFGLKILPANPYINALQGDLSEEQIARLGEIEPTNFAQVPVAGHVSEEGSEPLEL